MTEQKLTTPVDLANELSFHFPEDQAHAIAELVHQPLKEALDNAQRYREALEFYANFPYERGLVYVKKEDIPPAVDWATIKPTDVIPLAKYTHDKGEIAKKALKNKPEDQ